MTIPANILSIMNESRLGEASLRLFRAEDDSDRVKEIVAQIWSGGGPALTEKKYGMVGGKSWQQWIADAVLADFTNPDCRSFVAEHESSVIGFCSYTLDLQRSRGIVGYNGVALEYQGRGLGSAMIGFVMACIRAEGMQFAGVVVADNEEHAPARRIYEKHGFSKISGNYYMMQKLT